MVKPLVVCHQLRSPENLAAIARVMANFGLTQLVVSDPQTHEFRVAGRIAVKADDVLDAVAVATSLEEALGPVVYALGSTSRDQLKRQQPLSPEEGVARLKQHAARGPVALVLGGEKRGLSDHDLSLCHDVVVIPTDGPQPSMNLSHAAAVLLYLCSRSEAETTKAEVGAPLQLVQRLEAKMQEVLLQAEFLNPQAPQHVLKELSRALVRGQLTAREVQIWLAAFEHLGRFTRGPH